MAYVILIENEENLINTPFDYFERYNDYSDAIVAAQKEATAKGEIVNVINEQNGSVMFSTVDSAELSQYTRMTYDEWNEITQGNHEQTTHGTVYFDIDGTTGKWYGDMRGYTYEEILNPANHYFRDIEPHPVMIAFAERLQQEGVDVAIMSAADRNTIRDKWEWIDEHMPFVPKDNICFAPIGADKSFFVKGNTYASVLIDDYHVNLNNWQGKAIKAITPANSHQDVFSEIDFTEIEAAFEAAIASGEKITAAEFIKRNEQFESTVQQAVRLVKDSVKEMENAYEHSDEEVSSEPTNAEERALYQLYVREWTEVHIPEVIAEETRMTYDERPEEDADMTWNDYIAEYGYVGGDVPPSFEEFAENDLAAYFIASDIYRFLEQEEYDLNPENQNPYLKRSWDYAVPDIAYDLKNNPQEMRDFMTFYARDLLDETELDGDGYVEAHRLIDAIAKYQGEDIGNREAVYNLYYSGVDNEADKYDGAVKMVCEQLCEWIAADKKDGVADAQKCEEVMRFSPLGEDNTKFATDAEYRNNVTNNAVESAKAKTTAEKKPIVKDKHTIERD